MRRNKFYAALLGLLSGPAAAADLDVKVQIPQLEVAEYHRPYVALWLEGADARATSLSVWYEADRKNNEGTQWLKDLRQWWRRSGRELSLPVDGVSGATRNPGEHLLRFSGGKGALAGLPPGEYKLSIEAAREAGGREILSTPLHWPPKAPQQIKLRGEHELGAVAVEVKP